MKKFAAVFVILAAALSLTGCGTKMTESFVAYPWPVILIMKYQFLPSFNGTVNSGTIDIINNFLTSQTKDFDIEPSVYVSSGDKTLQVQLYFVNYKTFLQFNGLYTSDVDLNIVSYKVNEKIFFYEATKTFENPWKTIENNMSKVQTINDGVETVFSSDLVLPQNVGYYFVFDSAYRRTSVPAAYKSENAISDFYYYFYGNVEDENFSPEIVIFDRSENSPIWYTLAVAGTIIFMGVMYLILRSTQRKPQKDVQTLESDIQ